MTKAHNTASFVLRFRPTLWLDSEGEPHMQWGGHIHHVQGDEENNFTNVAEAIAFMQHHLLQLTADTLAGSRNMNQSRILLESLKLWERLASSYLDIMFQAMEQGLKQTDAITERLNQIREQTLKMWRLPNRQPDDHDEQILELLNALQSQIQGLSERVKTLEDTLQKNHQES